MDAMLNVKNVPCKVSIIFIAHLVKMFDVWTWQVWSQTRYFIPNKSSSNINRSDQSYTNHGEVCTHCDSYLTATTLLDWFFWSRWWMGIGNGM